FRLEVTVHHSLPVNVSKRIANLERHAYGPLWRKLPLIVEHLTHQSPFNPFQNHVKAAAILLGKNPNDAGMIQSGANRLLTLKAVVKDRVTFHLEVREF